MKNLIKRRAEWVVICGVIGAGFFFGDAIITPAISVLSAVEGLSVISPSFKPYVLSIALGVLFALFVFQYKGTAGVAKLFAPITFLWFIVLAFIGIWHLSDDWAIFAAINPLHGISMLVSRPGLSLLVIGGVFLAVTGGEALYADMGHFGKNPIRMAWLGVAFPALMLNYLGQGAFVIANPDSAANPFFLMFPSWVLIPVVVLTTMVTVIASQAVITGAYSIAQQAMSLNLLPRMIISHTSETESGQIYISQINWLLMFGVIMLVLIFRSSDNLASAYGIAVNAAMLINALLSILYFWNAKSMPRWIAVPALVLIFCVELVFMASNALKIENGGFLPLLIGIALIIVMLTWLRGRNILTQKYQRDSIELDSLLKSLERRPPARVAGAAVFMQTDAKYAPSALLHNLKHNRVLHDKLIFVNIETMPVPRWEDDRVIVRQGPLGAWMVDACFGYMEQPNVPEALRACAAHGLEVDPQQASYFLGRRVIRMSARSLMPFWQQRIFIILANHSARAIEFFRIPPDRVVELGMQMSV